MAAIAHDFRLPITDEETLREFLRLAAGVTIPDARICDHHVTPWRAFADAYFARYPVTVWFASRGFGGKSFLLALLAWTEAVTLRADVNILGASGEQSKRVHEYMLRFWSYESAPRYLLAGPPSSGRTSLAYGNTITALTASQKSVRGPHPQRLRLDEIDEMDMSILDASLGQPMERDGIKTQIVMSSTRQYSGGTMDKMLERAAARGWGVYEWCYRENLEPHGWLAKSEVERKRGIVTAEMWRAEYENQEPNPASRAIRPDALERMFDTAIGEYAGDVGEYIEIEPPTSGGVYATGTDWAKEKDWTIIETIRVDVNPARVVAWERTGRLDWPVMVARHEQRIRRYRGRAAHDATGIGNVIDDYLSEPSEGVEMVGRARSEMLTRYITAIEHGEIVSPMIRHKYAEHKFASNEDVFSSGKQHHLPDSIAAGALAWSLYRKAGVTPPRRAVRNRLAGIKHI